MSKLRMIQRKQVLTFTPVYDLHAKVLLGYLGDLTLKGGLMVSEKPMEIDRTMTLRIEFHVSTEIPSTHITLPARVAWCNLEEHRTYYNTGLEFLVVSDEDTKVIEAVLENYQFNHEMPR
jgi:hypothetical protein